MSAGGFTTTKYEANAGTIHAVVVQPETLAATIGGTANAAPTGAVDSPFWCQVSKAKGKYGLGPRFIRFNWDGTPPTGYLANESIKIPIMTQALWAAASVDDVVTYLGANGKVSRKIQEVLTPG